MESVDDADKYLLGRIIQFSYLYGNKKQREYSSDYCDISKVSHKEIGTFINWFIAVRPSDALDTDVSFKPADTLFTAGYVSMSNYSAKIDDSMLIESENSSVAFSVPKDVLNAVLPKWPDQLKF